MGIYFDNEFGKINISDSVIASITGMCAMETYGIVGMSSKSTADGLFELLKFDNLSKGIKVNSENGICNIDIYVIIEYGINIVTVANNLIEKAKFNIEKYTDLKVENINLHVQGIRTGRK